MTKHLHRDLEYLHGEILSLSAIVEEMINRLCRALVDGDRQEAYNVIASDEQVDQLEVRVEDDCLKMLALHQPVASDLRRIATVLKVNNDLERIADLAVNVAERAIALYECPEFPLPEKLGEMVEIAAEMVRMSLDTFVNLDARQARAICQRDDEVDRLNEEIIAELIETMQRRPQCIPAAMHCFSAARHVERIADHATNIAEDVIYLVEGDIVRHQHSS
ncbi:MAG: phosphate signaling complex protein PhoU [Pirellulaceae bacterium]